MYLQKGDFEKWVEYVNQNVKNETDGAFIAAETTDKGIGVEPQGSYEELLKCIASIVYSVGYVTAHDFDTVINDTRKAWEEIKKRDATVTMDDPREGKDGKRYIDPKTSFGYNDSDDTVQFPPIPEDVEKQILDFCNTHIDDLRRDIVRLESQEGVNEAIAEAYENGSLRVGFGEKGEIVCIFRYNGNKFLFSTDMPDYITSFKSKDDGDDENYQYNDMFDGKILCSTLQEMVKAVS